MKVLSVKQPWTYLVCAGIKPVENRSWKTKHRGRILLHASATSDKNVLYSEQQYNAIKEIGFEPYNMSGTLTRSAIIGSAEIIDCVQNHPSVWAEYGKYHWVMANTMLFKEPILGVKGKLGLWEYDGPVNFCHICGRVTGPEYICEICGEPYCTDCGASYNQFTRIDFNCCKECGESYKTME